MGVLIAKTSNDYPILDNFDSYTPGPVSSPWSSRDGAPYFYAGGLVGGSNAGAENLAFRSGDFNADQQFYFDVPTLPALDEGISFLFRCDANGTGYDLQYIRRSTATPDLRIVYYVNYAITTVIAGATYDLNLQAGGGIGVRAQGTSLKAYYRDPGGAWTECISVTDATYNQAGRIGMGMFGNVGRYDNLRGGNL